MTIIINYNLGNPKSIQNMLAYLGIESRISANHEDIASADRLILPGVGHFQRGMEQLEQLGLIDVLMKEVLENKKPILGICLGMQLLTKHSEEGNLAGLGFIDAQTKKFELKDVTLKVPHMGWNNVYQREDHPIWHRIADGSRFYFVHSYFVKAQYEASVIGSADYGFPFDAVIQQDNIVATQFHPEKSAASGLQLLQNFVAWDGNQ